MAGAAGGGGTKILIGLGLGAIVGVTLNALAASNTELKSVVDWIVANVTKPIGQIFINLLFLPIVPLVFASLALGVTKLGGAESVGRVGLKTVTYFILTTVCAAAIGLTLVNFIRPGDSIPEAQKDELMAYYAKEAGEKLDVNNPTLIETIVNIVPKNPLDSATKKDMLALIFTSILVGLALMQIDKEKADLMIQFLEGVNQITDFMIRTAMKLAPYAVFALIFSTTALFGYKLLIALSAFVGTVLLGLAVQWIVVYSVLVKVLGGMSPVDFFKKARGTMITAFSTSSSSATLPTAMKCAEEELGVPGPITRFVLPLSATMNHNGTALFEGVVVMFLAQAFGVDLTFTDQIGILFLCVLTATGMAGVPGGSLPLIGLILSRYGVPAASIALILGVDRILDMCRTMVNVTGDLTTVLYVSRSERDKTAES
jgi:dicarboxylate/amino acid:cation (Na+ or H+) symporter, DAACS family